MNYEKVWRKYRLKFNKNYTTPEKALEAKAFVKQCAYENRLINMALAENNDAFTVGLNDFSDQNLTELRRVLCPPIHPPSTQISLPILGDIFNIPSTQDYSRFLQPIVNQGACGSCWAFAPVAQLESMYLMNFPSFSYRFSPQFLVDCSRTSPNSGCNGGWPSVAMGETATFLWKRCDMHVLLPDYIVANGIPFGSSYCYSGVQNSCALTTPFFVFPRFGSKTVQYKLNGNETQLQQILSQQGPVTVVMYASTMFMGYKSGIFYDNACPTGCNNYNHAVLLIGWFIKFMTCTLLNLCFFF